MVYDWDSHKQTCYQLYIEEGRPLEDIMGHMKAVYDFTPSKRAFQTQFRRWNFPSKQHPAHKNEQLVSRIKQLWERNLSQKEMLRVLNEEDGFVISQRELSRVRTRNRWLLRAPNVEKPEVDDLSTADEILRNASPILDGDSTLSLPELALFLNPPEALSANSALAQMTAEGSTDLQHIDSTTSANVESKKSRRRKRQPAGATETELTARFPSEMTLEEARVILSLDPEAYREIRSCFQQICRDEGVNKKTEAGPERWDSVKDRLIREIPHLQHVTWGTKDKNEPKQLALDIICTDITKRTRAMASAMPLKEAKSILGRFGINPDGIRAIRDAFDTILHERGFESLTNTTPEEWRTMTGLLIERSIMLRPLARGRIDPQSLTLTALDVVARSVAKRRTARLESNAEDYHPYTPWREQLSEQQLRVLEQTQYLRPWNHQFKAMDIADSGELLPRHASEIAMRQMGALLGQDDASDTSEANLPPQMPRSASRDLASQVPMPLQPQSAGVDFGGLPPPQTVLGSSPHASVPPNPSNGSPGPRRPNQEDELDTRFNHFLRGFVAARRPGGGLDAPADTPVAQYREHLPTAIHPFPLNWKTRTIPNTILDVYNSVWFNFTQTNVFEIHLASLAVVVRHGGQERMFVLQNDLQLQRYLEYARPINAIIFYVELIRVPMRLAEPPVAAAAGP